MKTKIEYADHSFNFIRGCTKVSDGCKNCYAENMHMRFKNTFGDFNDVRILDSKLYFPNLPLNSGLKKPIVFVNTMSDTFHPVMQGDFYKYIKLFSIFRDNDLHFLVLTKRLDNMITAIELIRDYYKYEWTDFNKYYKNVWFGITVENIARFNELVPTFNNLGLKNKFISFEPLLDDVASVPDFDKYTSKIKWFIIGSESGKKKRYCDISWIDNIIYLSFFIPVFVKQYHLKNYGKTNTFTLYKNSETAMYSEYMQYPFI